MTTTMKRIDPAPQPGRRKADNPAQYQRYREAAQEHETDQSAEAFESAFQAVARYRRQQSTGPTDE